jgi:peptidoglycan L-alanyl-D-glutamate endopeptidase CwlK
MSADLDVRTLRHLATLDPAARQAFADFARAAKGVARQHGCDYVMICGNRTWAEQDALYAKGRTAPGAKVTNARGGYSNHNFGIAADFGVFRGKDYLDESEPVIARRVHLACAALAEEFGLTAGAHWQEFQDLPHYEIAVRGTMADRRRKFKEKGSLL